MRRKILTYLCCAVLFLASVSVFANKKEPPKPPNNKNNDIPPPQGLPIDGGISLIFIAGVTYGVYVIKKKLKISNN